VKLPHNAFSCSASSHATFNRRSVRTDHVCLHASASLPESANATSSLARVSGAKSILLGGDKALDTASVDKLCARTW
jgi:hypothetical protein